MFIIERDRWRRGLLISCQLTGDRSVRTGILTRHGRLFLGVFYFIILDGRLMFSRHLRTLIPMLYPEYSTHPIPRQAPNMVK